MALGTLYIAASPIGNLKDISQNLKETLEKANTVAAEDTRRSLKLLNHLGIKRPMLRCDEAQEERATVQIRRLLSQGSSVVLLSDAGTPGISDPGSRLIAALSQEGFPIIPVPGPSAVTTLLSVAGFKAVPFCFFGFIPKKGGEKTRMFEIISEGPYASIFFESPFRLQKTLGELAALAPNRKAVVGKELTKIHEEIVRGTLFELNERYKDKNILGEYTIAVAPLTKTELKKPKKKKYNLDEAE